MSDRKPWFWALLISAVAVQWALFGCSAEVTNSPPGGEASTSPSPVVSPSNSPGPSHATGECWFPGIDKPGCTELTSIDGQPPSRQAIDLANVIEMVSDGMGADGQIVFFVSIGQCRGWSIAARVAGQTWTPDKSQIFGRASGCATPDAYTAPEYDWILDLFSNPFHATVLDDQTVRIESGRAVIDFQWA